MRIGRRTVGEGRPCYIIAEAGVNHNGSLKLALRLAEGAREAGADAVKFQTFRAELLVARETPAAEYQRRNLGKKIRQFDMLKKLELKEEDFRVLSDRCKKIGVQFLSTPFDSESLAFLRRLGIVAIKIGSGDADNFLLLRDAARSGRPIILSTGMQTLRETRRSVAYLKSAGARSIAALHCTTGYPAPDGSVNLRAMDAMKKELKLPVGLSDHSEGTSIALAAVARGAVILEKHVTLDRRLAGPDHAASLELNEFAGMVREARRIEAALGDGDKRPQAAEAANRAAVARRLAFARDLPAGRRIAPNDLLALRMESGLSADRSDWAIGRKLKAPAKRFQPVRKGMLIEGRKSK